MKHVAIFGVPRSGTSWLGQLFNSSPRVAYRFQPLFSYAFKDRLDRGSSREDILAFYRELLATDDPFVLQDENISGNPTPDFDKDEITHLVWKEVRYLQLIENILEKTRTKIIGMVRHPCAVIYSWSNAPKEFDPSWDLKEEWRYAVKKNAGEEDFYGYERWKEATLSFIRLEKNYPERFIIQTFEELNRDPQGNLSRLFDFTGLPLESQTEHFIQESTQTSSDDPYGVYRKNKKNDEWTVRLDPEIADRILNDKIFKQINEKVGWEISRRHGD